MPSVLITGGTGFLGCHLARQFVKDGYKVTLYDIADLEAADLFGKVRVIKGDIRDEKRMYQATESHQYVVHAAAALPIQRAKELIFSVNLDGTQSVLEAAKAQNIKRVVFISTTAVYGVPKHLPEKEDSPLDPIGFYGESKVAAEKLCLLYQKQGLQVNILRPKTFLGPERLGVFQLWFEAIYNSKRVYILGSGENPYQLLAVSDVVSAVTKSLHAKVSGEIFNIGAKEFGTWREDLGWVIRQAASRSRITSIPVFPSQQLLMLLEILQLSPLAAWHYKTMPVASYVAIDKAEKLLKWHPKLSNRQLLLESFLWYKEQRTHFLGKQGKTHRVGWNFKILSLLARF